MKLLKVVNNSFSVQRIGGQRVAVDEAARLLFLWIKKGPYNRAGKRFGWKGPGIGVNVEILQYCDREGLTLCIILGAKEDRYYRARLQASDLLALVRKYQSWEKYDNVEVCILPFTRDLFETVINPQQVSTVLSCLEGDTHE